MLFLKHRKRGNWGRLAFMRHLRHSSIWTATSRNLSRICQVRLDLYRARLHVSSRSFCGHMRERIGGAIFVRTMIPMRIQIEWHRPDIFIIEHVSGGTTTGLRNQHDQQYQSWGVMRPSFAASFNISLAYIPPAIPPPISTMWGGIGFK